MPFVQVRVLGPVELGDGDRSVALGSHKERTLLALLATTSHRVLSVDHLTDELWEGDPPERAVEALRVYVSHLRKVLPDGALVTKPAGYVLELDTDAAQFEELAEKGSAALANGDPAGAAALLADALGLWRGSPFHDVADAPSLRAEAERLGEMRLAVFEDRVEADLALGRHRDVVGEITSYVAEYPLRERAWGQLMLALYRCGRQADALRAYQQARTKLIDELGIEPGPELRRLEAAILTQDPSLDLTPVSRPIRNNLPAPRSSFVGRRQELDAIDTLLNESRLVTLAGVGGCGKTRLALEVARRTRDRYPDGVFLVELASVADPAMVVPTIVSTMGYEVPGRDIATELGDRIADRTMLLLLDNCEHVIDATAEVANVLLARCPQLSIIATSREVIGIAGERAWRVPPLSLPSHGEAASDAVALFCERARAASAQFALTAHNTSTVVQICQRLDGMPLALELAAARLRALGIDQLAERLDDRFQLLTGGRRGAVERHQTLRATMDWSYELLDEHEKVLFNRLAVFAGGFFLEAAEEISGESDLNTVDVIERLVDKSLVAVTDWNGRARYSLLESVRQYALDKLIASGQAGKLQHRHREWFRGLALQAEPWSRTRTWMRMLHADADNFRAAIEYSLTRGEAERALDIVAGMANYWIFVSSLVEGLAWTDRVLAALDTDALTPKLFRVLVDKVTMATMRGQLDVSSSVIERLRSEPLVRANDVMKAEVSWQDVLAFFQEPTGPVPTLDPALLEESSGPPGLIAQAHLYLGAFLLKVDVDSARQHVERAIELADSVGYHVLVAPAKGFLAICVGWQGDVAASRRLREESVALITDDVIGLAMGGTLSAAAQAAAVVGDDTRAVELGRSDLLQMRNTGASMTLRPTIGALALVATRQRDLRRAALLWGVWGGRDPSLMPFLHYGIDLSVINEIRRDWPDEYEAGAEMSADEAIAFALEEL